MSDKQGYFQGGGGVNEPTPKKKKYKSEPTKPVQTRFKTPFFRNYDYTESKTGPGVGLYHGDMDRFKSVKDFIDKSRKRNKGKYKADADDAKDQSPKNKRSSRRIMLLKLAIDFPVDDQINSAPILGDSGTMPSANLIGDLDPYIPKNDLEGKTPDQLNFGRDYADDDRKSPIDLEALIEKYLNPAEPPIFGLPDGVLPIEDLDAPSKENPWYGMMDAGRDMYEDKWNI